MIKILENNLKEACQLTSAVWAVVADCEKGQWFVEAVYHLPKSRQLSLEKYLAQAAIGARLDAALQGDDPLPVVLSDDSKLGPGRLYAFHLPDSSKIVLVAARLLDAKDRRIWRLVASLIRKPESDDPSDIYMPSLQADLAYDLPRAVERILASFVRVVEPQGAWLAIRRGDVLNIVAQKNDPRLTGMSLSIESNRLLRRAHRTLGEVAAVNGGQEWENLPHPVGTLPNADYASDRILSLPLFPKMTDDDARDVVEAVKDVIAKNRK